MALCIHSDPFSRNSERSGFCSVINTYSGLRHRSPFGRRIAFKEAAAGGVAERRMMWRRPSVVAACSELVGLRTSAGLAAASTGKCQQQANGFRRCQARSAGTNPDSLLGVIDFERTPRPSVRRRHTTENEDLMTNWND